MPTPSLSIGAKVKVVGVPTYLCEEDQPIFEGLVGQTFEISDEVWVVGKGQLFELTIADNEFVFIEPELLEPV
jgi:hypothetical protein